MMSYVFIQTDSQLTEHVKKELKRYDIQVISELNHHKDLLAQVVTEDRQQLQHILKDELRPVEGVRKVAHVVIA